MWTRRIHGELTKPRASPLRRLPCGRSCMPRASTGAATRRLASAQRYASSISGWTPYQFQPGTGVCCQVSSATLVQATRPGPVA
jgi:hypothetical protein